MIRQPDPGYFTELSSHFARLARMWPTSHSSCYYVTYCEWGASQTTLLALASVHAGENLC